MDRKKDIIQTIKGISGQYSEYDVFADWIRCCAISISNSITLRRSPVWRQREDDYLQTINKYPSKDGLLFADMLGMLAETLESREEDALGAIYMGLGMGSKSTGQYFTPPRIV